MRKKIPGIYLFLFLAVTIKTSGQDSLYHNSFSLKDIRLLESPFKHAQDLNIQTLLKYNINRLLAPYFKAAGLTPKAANYTNWENTGLDGHIGGHYLSAVAIHYAATGNVLCKERMDSMIRELWKCQVANAADTNFTGYLGGVPNGKTIWTKIMNGNPSAIWDGWVPLYNIHKMYAGLRDAWLYGGNDTAKLMFVKFCDWGIRLCAKLSDTQMETMLGSEHGGMNEIYADAYQITGNIKYLNMAKRFSHKVIFNSMTSKADNMDNMHANTQVPKAVGFQRISEVSGDPAYTTASKFFWETVTQNRSLALGGNSRREFFPSASACVDYTTEPQGPESCNTNNMLKLTEGLFHQKAEAKYADFYERALFNHILSTQHPDHGGYVYFTSARPRHYRVYSAPNQAMWCCVGTGMENHGKYGEFIYTHNADTLFLNLFIASELNWKNKNITVTQQTSFPNEERTKLTIHVNSPVSFSLKVRHPFWVSAGKFKIIVNTDTLSVQSQPSSYALIDRLWNDGDSVKVLLPMENRLEELPNVPRYVAIMHGPILLGAKTGTESLAGLIADDSRWGHIAGGNLLPLYSAPIMLGDRSSFLTKIRPVSGQPLTFKTSGLFALEKDSALILEPFYKIHDARYMMYWMTATQEEYNIFMDSVKTMEDSVIFLNKRTIDVVAPGEQQPETDHNFKSSNSYTGTHMNEMWRDARDGGYISYTMRTNKEIRVFLFVRYWGNETGSRSFDIFANGVKIFRENLIGKWNTQKFVNVEYAIPDSLIDGKDSVVVRFVPLAGNVAGGIFNVRILRSVPEIKGRSRVCKGETGVNYIVDRPLNGATSYLWNLPVEASGSSTTNSINLSFGNNSLSDTLKTEGINSTDIVNKLYKIITVTDIPPAPTVTFSNGALHSSASQLNQWYLNNKIITGATGSKYLPTSAGNYSVIIDPDGCPSDTSNVYNLVITGLINPGFEDNVNARATGWTYEGVEGYVWTTVNTDGDNTKTGNNIMGIWNATFGDVKIYQTLTGMPNGIYKISADLMGSSNSSSSRLTTQRIFINDNSVLFGKNDGYDYSAQTLSVLQNTLKEKLTFAGHSVTMRDNGPFLLCEAIDTITNGTISVGVKTNGSASTLGFTFPKLTAGDGWGWFKVDNFRLIYMGVTSIKKTNRNDHPITINNGYITVAGIKTFEIYNINGVKISPKKQLNPGFYIVKFEGTCKKVIVQGF